MELESLYAAVFARPADDGARQVLADALQEVGDPRGEFLSLQLQNRKNQRSERRMQKLLERHRTEFLRGLSAIVMPGGDQRWDRGFLTEATVLLEGLHVDLPDLATLEQIDVVFSPATPLELASPHMRSLREVRQASLSAVPVLFAAKDPLATLEAVALSGPTNLLAWPQQTIDLLSSSTSLPRLSRLTFSTGMSNFPELDWVWNAPLVHRLKTLEFRGGFAGVALRDLLDVLRSLPAVPGAVVFHGGGVTLRLRAADRFRSLQVTELEPPKGALVLAAMLDTLPPDGLDELTVAALEPLEANLSGTLRMATKRLKLINLELP